MSALAEFLFPAPARRSAGAIIVWWERRRLVYNVLVGSAGSVSLGVLLLAQTIFGEGPQLSDSWIVSAVFGGMANVCYLLGPATEIVIHQLWGRRVLPIGPTLYRMGLTFSVGLALLPAFLIGLVGIVAAVVQLF